MIANLYSLVSYRTLKKDDGNVMLYNLNNHIEIQIDELSFKIIEYINVKGPTNIENLKYIFDEVDGREIDSFIDFLSKNGFLIMKGEEVMERFLNEYERVYNIDYFETMVDDTIKHVIIRGKNGKIKISSHDNNSIVANIKHMRMYTNELIKPQIANATYSIEYDYNKFSDMELEIIVPSKHYQVFEVFNENSPITIDSICCNKLTLATTNGTVSISCECSNADIETSNAKLDVNAKIVPNDHHQFNLITSNGTVDVIFNRNNDIGFIFDIKNDTDYIEKTINNIDGDLITERLSKRHSKLYSKGLENYNVKATINIITSNGQIFLKTRK